MYAYSEHFVLVLSHDEVVHLKCSMLGKMPGDRESKFANLKLAYAYMCGHPGKKLLFMGQEFAQWNEWSEERALDWYLLDDPSHKEMQQFTKKCMKLYSSYPCLYATDYKKTVPCRCSGKLQVPSGAGQPRKDTGKAADCG